MSSLNVLPSAPPEKLYPELLPDNFRLSRIGNIEKKNFWKNRELQKSRQQTATHYTAFGLGSLAAALSTTGVALSLTGPGIIAVAPSPWLASYTGVFRELRLSSVPKNT